MSLIIKPMKLFNYPKLHEGIVLLIEPWNSAWKSGHTEILKRKAPGAKATWNVAVDHGEDVVEIEYLSLSNKGEIVNQKVCLFPVVPEDITDDLLRFKLLEFVIRYFPEEDAKGTVCFPYAHFGDVIKDIAETRPNVNWIAFLE